MRFVVEHGDALTSRLFALSDDRVKLVSHDSLFPSEQQAYLPTFNPFAVEAYVDRIPGLAEQFVLLQDDSFFFGRHVFKSDFFTRDGQPRIMLADNWVAHMSSVLPRPMLSMLESAYDYSHKLLNDLYSWEAKRAKLMHQPLPLTREGFTSMHEWFAKEQLGTVQQPLLRPGQRNIVPVFLVAYMGFREMGYVRLSASEHVSNSIHKLDADMVSHIAVVVTTISSRSPTTN